MPGFWGKIPSRGDFVGAGLPRDVTDAWDHWISPALAQSQADLGEAWLPAWMEAPVWFFHAAAGLLGSAALAGLWMPSADRAGRPFPLLIATASAAGAAWFAAAEAAGRAALTDMLAPDALLGRLPADTGARLALSGSVWWTDGAPRVAACRLEFGALPGLARFARMLDARALDNGA
jgi:type VI secretion system protein ImpM